MNLIQKILVASILVFMILYGVESIILSYIDQGLNYEYFYLFSPFSFIPYILLIVGFQKQNIYNLGKFFKWFRIVTIIAFVIIIVSLLIKYNSNVESFFAFILYALSSVIPSSIFENIFMDLFTDVDWMFYVLYILPLWVLCLGFMYQSEYKFMKVFSIIIALLTILPFIGIYLPIGVLLIFMVGMLIDTYRNPKLSLQLETVNGKEVIE
ncbi:hypothetical protein [Sulfurimonas sp.]